MSILDRLEAEARAENPDVSAEYLRSRSSSPAAPLIPLPPRREESSGVRASPSLATLETDDKSSANTPDTSMAVDSPAVAQPDDQPVAGPSNSAPAPPVKVVKKRPLPKSPPPKKPPKPQPTIRMQLDLTGASAKLHRGETLEWNYEQKAREMGLRVIQSESEKEDSDSEGSDDEEGDDEVAKPKEPTMSADTIAVLGKAPEQRAPAKRKKRIEDRDEGYDTDDSFVDDSELHFDMPKFYVRPARDGFFVSTGPLALYEIEQGKGRKGKATTSKAAAKGKGKAAAAAAATAEPEEPPKKRAKKAPQTNGTTKSPARGRGASVKKEEDDGAKRMSFATAGDSPEKKSKKADVPKADINNFTPELQEMARKLIPLIDSAEFVPKNKFPDVLKPPLHEFALKAVEKGQYDEHFFSYLESIFPYNRFTMAKLTKREIYPMRKEAMQAQQEKLIGELEKRIPEQMEASEAQHTKDMDAYNTKLAKWQEEHAGKGSEAMAVDGEDTKPKSKKDKEPSAPVKKLMFTEQMRKLLWEIVVLDEKLIELQIEKAELEKNEEDKPKEKNRRKELYARLLELFPDGWMTTTLISRQWSQAKIKYGGGGDAVDED